MRYLIVPANNYAYLTCVNNFALNDLVEALRDVHKVLDAIGSDRVLIDVTALKSFPKTVELFNWAELFWQEFSPSGRIAMVIRWDQNRFAKLLETLVRTIGIHLAVFVSEEQAEAWALQGKRRQVDFNTDPKFLVYGHKLKFKRS